MFDKIYMIAWASQDEDGYSTDTLDESYGFFLSEEVAQAWVDARHNFEKNYLEYLNQIEVKNAMSQKEFEVKVRVWDEMKAEGINPGFFKPVKAYHEEPLSFDRYAEANRKYAIVEVDRAN